MRKIIISLVVFFVLINSVYAVYKEENLHAYWYLNDTNDIGSNNLDVTARSNTSFITNGCMNSNGCLNITGTTNTGLYRDSVTNFQGNQTWSVWTVPGIWDSTTRSTYVTTLRNDSARTYDYSWVLTNATDYQGFTVGYGINNSHWYRNLTTNNFLTALDSEKWHMYSWTFRKNGTTTGVFEYYLDGQPIGNLTDVEIQLRNQVFNIGSEYQGIDGRIGTLIQNLGWWNVSFTDAEIAALYDDEKPVLAAYYNFNENSGTTAADSSGNGNNGAINGAIWTIGINGSALKFDGIDDYVEMPNTEEFGKNWSEISVSAWIYLNSNTASVSEIYSKNVWTGGENNALFELHGGPVYDNKFVFRTHTTTDNHANVYSTSQVQTGKWYHIVGTYNSSVMSIYIDGQLENETSMNGTLVSSYTQYNLTVGVKRQNTGLYNFFNGTIDEIKIWNISLSASEILAEYNSMCIPNWTVQYDSCLINDSKLKYYTDENSCGRVLDLPSDNGTYENCSYCAPNWECNAHNASGYCNSTLDVGGCEVAYSGNYSEFPISNFTDSIAGNDSSINSTDNLTVLIGNQSIGNWSSMTSTLEVVFKQGNNILLEFSQNFSENVLNLTNIIVEKQNGVGAVKGYIFVSGIQQEGNKTIYLHNVSTNFNWVCIKDVDLTDISEITPNCNGANESHIQCNNQTSSGYRCEDLGNDVYKITGLQHSGIIQADAPITPPSGGGGGGSSSKLKCGDGICSTSIGENCSSCPIDCGECEAETVLIEEEPVESEIITGSEEVEEEKEEVIVVEKQIEEPEFNLYLLLIPLGVIVIISMVFIYSKKK